MWQWTANVCQQIGGKRGEVMMRTHPNAGIVRPEPHDQTPAREQHRRVALHGHGRERGRVAVPVLRQLAEHLEDVAVKVHGVAAARVVGRDEVVAVDDELDHVAGVDDVGVRLAVDDRVRGVETGRQGRVERGRARGDVRVRALGDAVVG